MRRLFEFSDQEWLPRSFRDLLTELLAHQLAKYRVYEPAVQKLNDTLRRAGTSEILDLCSGAGGPLPQLLPMLEAKRFALSDLYPNQRAREAGADDVTYLPDPVDARDVPRGLRACRTMFTSFHHFAPRDARRILESAAEAGVPIAVFEFTERAMVGPRLLLTAPWSVLRDTWTMRPRRWSRLFWTYVVPVIPAIYTWDALVSHRRTYSVDELLALTEGIEGYAWDAGRLPPDAARGWITYLVGIPAS